MNSCPMILYPAIDLKDGQCVRLLRGEMTSATVFGDDPAAQASAFAEAGCRWIHLVDLNGAFEGKSVNTIAVKAILKEVEKADIPVQLGGGIRDMAAVETWLSRGLARVILGTAAVRDPEFVRAAAKEFPGKIAVGIDARRGMVAVEGWAETTDISALELAKRFEDAGVAAIVYTDIDRDGMMKGPAVDATAALAKAVAIPVIASGGVSSLKDLVELRNCSVALGKALDGVIVGRALYDGAINIREALALLDNREMEKEQ